MPFATRLASLVPATAVARFVNAVYPRIEPELRALDTWCPHGGTALDIGGWYGPWAVRLARRADRVVTFEPVPAVAAVLRAIVPANVEVVQAAVSDREGEASVWLPPEGGGRGVSSMSRSVERDVEVAVRTVTVDGLGVNDVRVMKVDVEGHEVPALLGAEKTIRRDLPVILTEAEYRHQDVGALVELLAGWGYSAWVRPERAWIPLAGYDLAAHQERTRHAVEVGFVRRLAWPRPRYVNSVLFVPGDGPPGRP